MKQYPIELSTRKIGENITRLSAMKAAALPSAIRWATSGALVASAAFAMMPQVEAATYTVDTTSDSTAVDCTGASQFIDCSLRGALSLSNASGTPDIIQFALPNGSTIFLSTGTDLQITDAVEIIGPGSGSLTIDAHRSDSLSAQSRVFYIYEAAGAGTNVTISGLTLKNGVPPGDEGGCIAGYSTDLILDDVHIQDCTSFGWGGGIHLEDGTLALNNSVVSGNTAQDAGGGGVYIYSGSYAVDLSIVNSQITGNSSTRSGAGIYFGGGGGNNNFLSIQNSTISRNALSAGANTSVGGGGLHIGSFTGQKVTATIDNSTFNNNTSSASGAGINVNIADVYSYQSTLTLTNVTISSNTAGTIANTTGGGMAIRAANTADVALHSSTIFGNTATLGTGGVAHDPNNSVSSLVVENTVIGQNDTDLSGLATVNYSLVESVDLTNTGAGNIHATPRFSGLADFGGVTCTHAPLQGSPALDAGISSPSGYTLPLTDQRGGGTNTAYPRQVDNPFSTNSVAEPDMGAVELRSADIPLVDGIFKNGFDDSINGYAVSNCP